jgi:hypothetical protein
MRGPHILVTVAPGRAAASADTAQLAAVIEPDS